MPRTLTPVARLGRSNSLRGCPASPRMCRTSNADRYSWFTGILQTPVEYLQKSACDKLQRTKLNSYGPHWPSQRFDLAILPHLIIGIHAQVSLIQPGDMCFEKLALKASDEVVQTEPSHPGPQRSAQNLQEGERRCLVRRYILDDWLGARDGSEGGSVGTVRRLLNTIVLPKTRARFCRDPSLPFVLQGRLVKHRRVGSATGISHLGHRGSGHTVRQACTLGKEAARVWTS